MKKVLLMLYKSKSHSLYKQFINNPPKGYEYVTLDNFTDEFLFKPTKNIFLEIFNKIERNYQIIKIAKKNQVDIIYCCDGIMLFNSPIPWVLELEHATSLIAHNFKIWKIAKKVVPFFLKQRNLKYIIPWTKAGSDSLVSNLELGNDVLAKIKPIYLCLNKINSFDDVEKKKIKHKKFSMLFVTSVNYNGEGEFYSKGGKIVIETYNQLKKIIEVSLILRSRIPDEYAYLKDNPDVEIYEENMPYDEFEKLFLMADIFLFPGYQSPGLVFLDAMNYNLPIIATDVFANKEMVKEKWNGFLINFPKNSNVHYLKKRFNIKVIPSGNMAKVDVTNEKTIDSFVKKIKEIKRNEKLRQSMRKNSTKLLLKEYCLLKHNRQLKEIFNKTLN